MLEAAPGIKYKAALGVPYGAGLRVSEVAHLQVDDIDSERMLIRVEQGKGARDRSAMLSPPRTSARDDARDPRVHPLLPDARPASRLPSHPPLRPARRLHTQGHAWPGPPPSPRCHAERTTARADARLSAAMPLLRRAHARHRSLSPLAPTSRSAATHHAHPDTRAMTRHGLIFYRVRASTRWATPRTPFTFLLRGAALCEPPPRASLLPRDPGEHRLLHHSACAHPDHTLLKHNSR